jgi:hypothetical protein
MLGFVPGAPQPPPAAPAPAPMVTGDAAVALPADAGQ